MYTIKAGKKKAKFHAEGTCRYCEAVMGEEVVTFSPPGLSIYRDCTNCGTEIRLEFTDEKPLSLLKRLMRNWG